MSRVDQITGQKPRTGNTRSHAKNHSRRTFGLNLQRATAKIGGKVVKVRVTAKTKKTLKKQGKLVK
jgi:large subunit ribosomal protein L28